jgi:hypothetical protein
VRSREGIFLQSTRKILEQLDVFAGSFPNFDAVPINVIGYTKPISVSHFIHIIEDETLNYKATQYVVTLISLENGMITYTFGFILNCHAILSVNEESSEFNLGINVIPRLQKVMHYAKFD